MVSTLLCFSLSLFFRSILLHLQHAKRVTPIPPNGMHSLHFSIFASFMHIILRSILFNYSIQFLFVFIPLSLVFTVPLSIQNGESSCDCTERVCPNPLIERRMKQAWEWGSWSADSLSSPPSMGGQKATPSPVFDPLPVYPILLPVLWAVSCLVSVSIL